MRRDSAWHTGIGARSCTSISAIIRIEVEEDGTFYRTYLGGRGIGYHYLLTEETKGC
jgi:hypothetical protein